MFGLNTKFEIKTKNGFEDFRGIQVLENQKTYKIILENNVHLNCTINHKLNTPFGFVELSKLFEGDVVETANGFSKILAIKQNQKLENVYDILDAGKDKSYFTNDILSHNCEFLGSAATLISGPKLRQLSFINPIYHDDNLDIYEYPNKGKKDDAGNWTEMPHIYCLTVDTSRGLGGDYSAFSVIDVSQIPYRQVAKYRSNDIAPILFPNIIYDVGTKYNDAYDLVEINDIGQQVVDLLHKDLEYDNIFKIESSQKKGQNISAGHKKSIQFGLRTTTKTKRIGCANLKTLVESDKLIVNDFDTVNELSTFVRKKDSYEAEEGNNDDLAMTLVLFGWMISQGYFKDSTNTDLRKSFMQEQLEMIEQDLTPFGFIEDGIRAERKVESGDIWLESPVKYLPSNL
jgi:hypothetical protein